MNLLRLWYVDEQYLDSLYNQICEGVSQIVISEGQTVDKEGNLGIEIGNLLGKLGFPVGLSLRTRFSIGKNVISEKTITPSVELKIQKLQNYNGKKHQLSEIVRYDSDVKGIVWVSDMFTLLELYYLGNKDRNLIHHLNFIEKPDELVWYMQWSMKVDNSKRNYENCEELIKDVRVEMHLGGEKIRRNIKHITTAIEKYHPFDFDVIGDLSKIDNCTYTLKPIVIYQDDRSI